MTYFEEWTAADEKNAEIVRQLIGNKNSAKVSELCERIFSAGYVLGNDEGVNAK